MEYPKTEIDSIYSEAVQIKDAYKIPLRDALTILKIHALNNQDKTLVGIANRIEDLSGSF